VDDSKNGNAATNGVAAIRAIVSALGRFTAIVVSSCWATLRDCLQGRNLGHLAVASNKTSGAMR
jgi:hypothetical protein